MSEFRLLPIIRIHDTDFYVDMAKLEFRQVDNDKNAISFHDVQSYPMHNEFTYDPKTRNAFHGTFEEMQQRTDLVLIQLPATIDLDTQYIADEILKNERQKYLDRQRSFDQQGKDEEKIPNVNQQKKGHGL